MSFLFEAKIFAVLLHIQYKFYSLFILFSGKYVKMLVLKFTMFCASNQKCPIIKVSYLLWDSYAHLRWDFLLTSDNACAKLSLLQYLSFALAKHRLRVSQTVLLCPFDIAYLCLFYPAIIGCTSILNSKSTAIVTVLFFAILMPLEGSFVNLSLY